MVFSARISWIIANGRDRPVTCCRQRPVARPVGAPYETRRSGEVMELERSVVVCGCERVIGQIAFVMAISLGSIARSTCQILPNTMSTIILMLQSGRSPLCHDPKDRTNLIAELVQKRTRLGKLWLSTFLKMKTSVPLNEWRP